MARRKKQDTYQLCLWDAPEKQKKKRERKKTQSAKVRRVVADFLMLGAGVQSSTVAEMIVEGELPKPEAVIFADTGNEPPWVNEQVLYLKAVLAGVGVPLVIVRNGHILEDIQTSEKHFASMPLYTVNTRTGKKGLLRRQCTNQYKIIPADNYIRNWMIENDYGKWSKPDKNGTIRRLINRDCAVRLWYGISSDETFRVAGNDGWKVNYYPLIEKQMSRVDCEKWLKDHNKPIPKKSSCVICPYHGDDYWLMLESDYPPVFEIACLFDDDLRNPNSKFYFKRKNEAVYLHQSCVPLREINFKERKKRKERNPFEIEWVLSRPCGFNGGGSCET